MKGALHIAAVFAVLVTTTFVGIVAYDEFIIYRTNLEIREAFQHFHDRFKDCPKQNQIVFYTCYQKILHHHV